MGESGRWETRVGRVLYGDSVRWERVVDGREWYGRWRRERERGGRENQTYCNRDSVVANYDLWW